jgi:hypothetical protein
MSINNKSRAWFISFSFVLLTFFQSATAAVWTIVYPQSEVANDIRHDYPIALLDLALQKTGVRYELKPSLKPLRQIRALKRLEENLEVNVVWSMTDVQREQQLRPIRIPIYRGLIGWRVFLAHKNSRFLTVPINNMADLLNYSAVQGITWPDTKILQANGFNVITGTDYIESTQIINNKLADFFPRSVIEVFQELDNQYSTNLRLRKNIAIYYASAVYFFTNKQNVTLSRLIETGLQRAIEDGSFEQLFTEYYGETIQQLDIKNSLYFRLANPLLPPLTPIDKNEYWYFPVRG